MKSWLKRLTALTAPVASSRTWRPTASFAMEDMDVDMEVCSSTNEFQVRTKCKAVLKMWWKINGKESHANMIKTPLSLLPDYVFQSVGPQAKRARGSGMTRASSRGPHRPTSRGGFSAQNRLDQLRSGQQGTSPSSESNGTLQNGGYKWVRNESASDSSSVGGAKFATPRGQSKRY